MKNKEECRMDNTCCKKKCCAFVVILVLLSLPLLMLKGSCGMHSKMKKSGVDVKVHKLHPYNQCMMNILFKSEVSARRAKIKTNTYNEDVSFAHETCRGLLDSRTAPRTVSQSSSNQNQSKVVAKK